MVVSSKQEQSALPILNEQSAQFISVTPFNNGKSHYASFAILPIHLFLLIYTWTKSNFCYRKQPWLLPSNPLLQGFTVIGISLNFEQSASWQWYDIKGVSVCLCTSGVHHHVNINQHPKGQISTSTTWPYILIAPWSGSMANLWYQPTMFGPIQIVYRLFQISGPTPLLLLD